MPTSTPNWTETKQRNFKGFDDYVEIFRGGPQVDSSGKRHDGDAMIDKAVASFLASEHQPPLVVGHPKDNEPAFGWVKELRTATTNGVKTLMAKFENVVPEFEELVAKGRYKKRSASFYPDGRLRHVGFLGAVPPAVKGLADLKFEDGHQELVTFDFIDNKTGILARFMGRIREFLIEKEGMDTADRVVSNWEIDELKWVDEAEAVENPVLYAENNQKMGDEKVSEKSNNFTEADLEAAKKAAKDEARAEAAAEFAEQEQTRKKGEELAAIKSFCDKGLAEGKILPAWIDGGMAKFMESLAGEAAVTFSEGNSRPPLAWFMDFMDKLPQVVPLQEVALRGDKGADNSDACDIARRARDFQDAEAKAGHTISITEAVAHVTK